MRRLKHRQPQASPEQGQNEYGGGAGSALLIAFADLAADGKNLKPRQGGERPMPMEDSKALRLYAIFGA